jgi:small subunit ribosomal protein S17
MAEKVKKAAKPDASDIGLDVKAPESRCEDKHCPFHGTLPVRGTVITGTVVSNKMQGTVVVERGYMRELPKFERMEKRTGRYLAHSPPCIAPQPGDQVTIMECRPLSKRVSFVVIEKK